MKTYPAMCGYHKIVLNWWRDDMDKRRIKLEEHIDVFTKQMKVEKRNLDRVISHDDVINIKITLNLCKNINEFLECI